MKITGPVAPKPSKKVRTGPLAALGGCASGCASAVAAIALAIGTAAGGAWELLQPRHYAEARVPDGTCALTWWRSALGGARYKLTCDAVRPLEVEHLKLLSGPRGVELVESVEDWGQRPWEDQRPMAGQTIDVDKGRTWTYTGTMSLGPIPYVGPPASVHFSSVVDGERIRITAVE